jgi:hypothetical protein
MMPVSEYKGEFGWELFSNHNLPRVVRLIAAKDPSEPFKATWLATEMVENPSNLYAVLTRLRNCGLIGPPAEPGSEDRFNGSNLYKIESPVWGLLDGLCELTLELDSGSYES